MNNLAKFFNRFWLPSLEVLSDMERVGITLDVGLLEKQAELALSEAAELERSLEYWTSDYVRQREDQSINWGSHVQLKEFLYEFKCFPVPPVCGTLSATKRNSKRAQVSDEAALDWLSKNTNSSKEIRALMKARKTRKLAQFMQKLPGHISPDGRLRYSIGPSTDTGRLACKNPNLQQIPVRNDRFGIRKAFTAAPGHLLVVSDFSQLEMYVMAHFLIYRLGDHSLAEQLASGDVHTNVAFEVWGTELKALGATPENIKDVAKKFRDNAKTLNYAMPYGKTAGGLGAQILDAHGVGIGKKAAQDLIDAYFEAKPGLAELFALWKSETAESGYIHTLLGRTRPLPGINSENKWERWAAERRAVNTAVQGSAADIVTAAMCASVGVGPTSKVKPLARELRTLGAKLVLQVHDELIFEVPEDHAECCRTLVQEIMENPFDVPLKVQLKCDAQIGKTWADCK